MKLNWNRVLRTFVQSASGAGVAFITAIAANFSKESAITSIITFVSTVVIAVLMNIQKQTEENEDEFYG